MKPRTVEEARAMAKGHKPRGNPKLAQKVQDMLRKSGIPTATNVKIGPYKAKGSGRK
jgi:hypothetical protein